MDILRHFVFRFHQLEGPKMVGVPGDPVKTQLKAKTQWRICEKLLLESSAICNDKAKHLAYGNAELYWLSKYRDKEPRSWYNFHWPLKRIQQLIFEVYYQQAFDHLSKKSFHFMREWVLKLWILNILIHNILSGIHFPRGWERPFGIWSKYCSNLISWMYRCNQFSFFLW